MFLDAHGLLDDLDLLDAPRSGGGVLKLATAIGAMRERVVLGLVDLLGWKLRALMFRMAGLTATAAFLVLALRTVLGSLDDITGRRLGGIAGMLSRRGQLGFDAATRCSSLAASRTIRSSHVEYARKSAAAQLRRFPGFREPVRVSYSREAVTVGFLALALREAREWFLQKQKTLYGNLDLRWTFNIGLPSADFANEALCKVYDMVAQAAWALSVRKGALYLQAASEILDSPGRSDQVNERGGRNPVHSRSRSGSRGICEVNASAEEGLHLLVDVGATTLDVCSFVLHKTADYHNNYALLTADVRDLGASILYSERVSAVRKAVNGHVKSLWNQYDPVSPMTDDVGLCAAP